ncbi:MAG: hypothetical protein C4554_10575 [Dethiobacter sp.]|nr:MAG: hypothetical protein C4554_10575 [Dethiobacter sp.]
MEKEHDSLGQLSYTSFLPKDMVKERINHREYNRALKVDGKLMCAGPVTDYRWAMFIYKVEFEEEARSLIEADPFFKCGFFIDYEINGWYYRI